MTAPSGLKQRLFTRNALEKFRDSFPVAVCQTLSPPSRALDAMNAPEGSKVTLVTSSECPAKFRTSFPVRTFQSLTVPSLLPETSSFEPGANATDRT